MPGHNNGRFAIPFNDKITKQGNEGRQHQRVHCFPIHKRIIYPLKSYYNKTLRDYRSVSDEVYYCLPGFGSSVAGFS